MATGKVEMMRKTVLACGFSMGLLAILAPTAARADEQAPPPEPAAAPSLHPGVGGHLGIATPLVTVTSDNTTTISDQFTLAFPIGIGFPLTDKLAIDFETIVGNPIHPRGTTSFTVDPGVVYNLGTVVIGLRIKWDVQAATNVGLIPLIHKGVADLGHGANWFVEAAFPTSLSFSGPAAGTTGADKTTFSFNVVFHTGIGF
jgi:hypothetical protein